MITQWDVIAPLTPNIMTDIEILSGVVDSQSIQAVNSSKPEIDWEFINVTIDNYQEQWELGIISEADPTLFDTIQDESVTWSDVIDSTLPVESMPPAQPIVPVEPTTPVEPVVSGTTEQWDITSTPAPSNSIPQSEVIVPTQSSVTKIEEWTVQVNGSLNNVEWSKWTKTYITIGVIIVILIVIGVVGWFYTGAKEADVVPVVQTPSAVSGESPIGYNEEIQKQTIESSKNIEIMNNALTEWNLQLCDSIVSDSMKIECRESIDARNITQSWTLEDCQKLTLEGIRNNCVSVVTQSMAVIKLDKQICSGITDSSQSQYCRDSVDEKIFVDIIDKKSASEDKCNLLEERFRQPCIAAIVRNDDNAIIQSAVANEDLESCKKLSTEELQSTCFDTILLKQALKSQDKNLCDYVKDETKKATCISYTVAQDDNAVFKKAIIEKDITLCSKIGSKTLKDRCHDSVTLLIVRDTKSTELCDSLVATGGIDACKKSAWVQ